MQRAIGHLIKELHKRSGLNRDEFAERIRIQPTYLSAIENGNQPGSRKILEDALACVNLGYGDLRIREDMPQTEAEQSILKLFRALSQERQQHILETLRTFVAFEELENQRQRRRHLSK